MRPDKLAIADRIMAALADLNGVPLTAGEIAARIGNVPGGPASRWWTDGTPWRPAQAADVYARLVQLSSAGQVTRAGIPAGSGVRWRRLAPVYPLPAWSEDGAR